MRSQIRKSPAQRKHMKGTEPASETSLTLTPMG
jgi:hypothetical protein